MLQERTFQAKITVTFSEREDGGVRAECDDIPGFFLSSIDTEALLDDIVPVLEQLLKSNYDLDVEVIELTPAKYLLQEKKAAERKIDMSKLEFTYHARKAA